MVLRSRKLPSDNLIAKMRTDDEAPLQEVRGKTYRDDTVHLDGVRFVDCIFIRCNLVYAGGEHAFGGGITMDQCVWKFEGAAARTITILSRINLADPATIQHVLSDPFDTAKDKGH